MSDELKLLAKIKELCDMKMANPQTYESECVEKYSAIKSWVDVYEFKYELVSVTEILPEVKK